MGSPTGTGQDERSGLTRLLEHLIAVATVAGAAVYVLINAVYVEFYDDFGIRPEDVGWDRLTILGRAAWVALAVVILAAVAGIWSFLSGHSGWWSHALQRQASPGSAAAGVRALVLLLAAFLFFGGFAILMSRIESEADRVRVGQTVNGIGWLAPFIDVRADRVARVTWLGEADRRPAELGSRYLLYLGRGRDLAVFVSCGQTTVLVPAGDVAVDIAIDEGDVPGLDQTRTMKRQCGR